jgi:hypothetical protein
VELDLHRSPLSYIRNTAGAKEPSMWVEFGVGAAVIIVLIVIARSLASAERSIDVGPVSRGWLTEYKSNKSESSWH